MKQPPNKGETGGVGVRRIEEALNGRPNAELCSGYLYLSTSAIYSSTRWLYSSMASLALAAASSRACSGSLAPESISSTPR